MSSNALVKEIGGYVWHWRFPNVDYDLDALFEREEMLERFPDSPLAEVWKSEIEYLKWINHWD